MRPGWNQAGVGTTPPLPPPLLAFLPPSAAASPSSLAVLIGLDLVYRVGRSVKRSISYTDTGQTDTQGTYIASWLRCSWCGWCKARGGRGASLCVRGLCV